LKLHLAQLPNQNVITGYGDGYVNINGQRYDNNLIVSAKTIVVDWSANFETELDESHLVPVLALAPQIVVIGSGARLRFPKPAALKALIAAKIGYEVMDTHAACRTYNILLEEGRNVAAALILG
jgi:uncharacterized protein